MRLSERAMTNYALPDAGCASSAATARVFRALQFLFHLLSQLSLARYRFCYVPAVTADFVRSLV
jgi:hypothetical protein